ncbi:hypothetical protein GALL_526100 [mine drainage metagenome]|uniref:Uncharacterized protein n=1 Tax=mine drainage metagenome TaxID=410659 RepID=A0A1J5PQG9_9ZZZZ
MTPEVWVQPVAPDSKPPFLISSLEVVVAGLTVTVRVAELATPVLSVAVKVTVRVTAVVPVLVKVWLAVAPVAVLPSPKFQA